MRTGKVKFANGVCHYEQRGAVTCKRYKGQFGSDDLQAKADTGLWYTLIEGNGRAIQGEGPTPELAIRDAIKRNREISKILETAAKTLEASLS